MNKNQKMIIGLVVGMVVLFGALAVVRISTPDLLSGNMANLNPSGSVCRKMSRALYKNDLYSDGLGDLNLNWDSAIGCGKKFPYMFSKSLKMNIGEDTCSMLRDWLDGGTLTAAVSAFRIGTGMPVACAAQFRGAWFGEQDVNNVGNISPENTAPPTAPEKTLNAPGGNDYSILSRENCQRYNSWMNQGTLTANFEVFAIPGTMGDHIYQCQASFPEAMNVSCDTVKSWVSQGVLTTNLQNQGNDLSVVKNCAK